jgi:hypothetical protein
MDSALTKPSERPDHRHGARTHLFVIATLCWDSGSTPVHVRNMSAKGALIEAAVVPKPVHLVVLKRGSLQVSGRVAWSASRQAGLAFHVMVSVTDWRAKRANAQQDQIDKIVSALKSAADPNDHPVPVSISPDRPAAIEAELTLLSAELAQLGNGLAADVILVATHPEIQLLDIALQRIGAMGADSMESHGTPTI